MPYTLLPSNNKFSSSLYSRQLLVSYAPDWIITFVLAAIFYSLNTVDGFQRQFSLSDISLRYPYAVHERVPVPALYLISVVAPFSIQCLVNYITVRTLGLVLGLALTGSITQFTKITVGRPRPDIIDRCQPIAGSADPTYRLSSAAICTQTDVYIMRDGFRSFPSGHSSMSFAGLAFLAFYLAGKLHLFDRKGHVGKAWISLTPFAGAALVAISRTMDYRHHWQDVVVGSLLGTVMAYFSYRQYFPSLAADMCHQPHAPRIERESAHGLPVHFSRHLSTTSHYSVASALGHSQAPPGNYTDDPSSSASILELDGRSGDETLRTEPNSLPDLWDQGEEAAPRV
ncbi:PAP2-domain-containing protein [Lentinula aciculospora]|uniref:PAP2-domain-containing protein n=1 Tax=Lentinula aciculospora TaxID=153920 RepID=A0A9W9ASB1_9AGAR|nr:PAP2-domain-containing protein [Lentinula aciculospora]